MNILKSIKKYASMVMLVGVNIAIAVVYPYCGQEEDLCTYLRPVYMQKPSKCICVCPDCGMMKRDCMCDRP